MKKIFGVVIMLLMAVATLTATEKTTINRMVLKAAQEFNQVVVSGDVTVELRYNPEKAGYIVYHYDKNASKEVRCFNDGAVLHVQGRADAVMTRIVVYYGNELTGIVNNGDARLVAHRLKCDGQTFKIVSNGRGDVKIGRIKSSAVELIANSSGCIEVRKVKADNVDAVMNGAGNIVFGNQPGRLNVSRNGSGNVVNQANK